MSPPDPAALPATHPPAPGADRQALAAFAREAPLTYGTWGRFKRLYKTAEANALADADLLGVLAARLDAAPLSSPPAALPVALGPDVRGVASIAAAGRRAYLLLDGPGRTRRLAGYEFDPADPLHPTLLGGVEVRSASSLTLCGPLVCLLSGGLDTGSLSVFDPSGPRWRGTVALNGYARAVGLAPHVYAAVAGQRSAWSGLRILDLTDPDQPRVAGEVEIRQAQAVACDGRLAAVTSGETRFRWGQPPGTAGLHFVDVSIPQRPRVLGALSLGSASAVALRGTLALVGVDRTGPGSQAGLQAVDVSDPARPRMRGFLATGYHAPQSIVLHGDFAYLTTQYGGPPQVVDISRPDKLTTAGQMRAPAATVVAVSEDTAYVGTPSQGLSLYHLANPARPARIGTPPSGATLGYMKRRVRRLLRNFAKTDPDGYIALAAATLAAARAGEGAALDPAFDPARQWVLADILYGGSGRYTQGRHGRGALAEAGPPRLRLRTREERAPQAWDRRLDTAASLLLTPALPWPVHEAMLKILRANGAAPPAAPAESLAGFLLSPSGLLARFAARALITLIEDGGAVTPDLAATAYVKTGAARRRVLEAALGRHAADALWAGAFAERVLSLAGAALRDERLPRRHALACEMIARRFPGLVPDARVRAMAAALLRADRPALTALVLALARRATPPEALDWLQAVSTVGGAPGERAVSALAEGLAGRAFTQAEAEAMVLRHGDEFVRAAGWRLLAGGATAPAVFRALWTGLLDSPRETPALRTAMTSPAALSGLARAGLSPQDIADRLRDRPFLAGLLSPPTFAAILPTVPASVALHLVAAVADDRWPDFRPFLLDHLRAGRGLAAFWGAAPAALDADGTGRLGRRLLEDAAVADTLARADDPGLLSLRDPAFGPALGRWARAHPELFAANSPLLLQAATHVLPDVRAWALDRAQSLGLDLPFALRLLESGLPASAQAGGAFFTQLPHGGSGERGHALALCDSPVAPVRALGRAFVSDRWGTLPRQDLLRALFENSHPDMQAFVAGLLSQSPDRPAESARFDGEVLRARHTARRAKEQVKARQSLEPTVDVPTLLALARGRVPRDAEWALGQLAKLALAGHEIEGLTVSGVAGG